jgi:hypothetical protein
MSSNQGHEGTKLYYLPLHHFLVELVLCETQLIVHICSIVVCWNCTPVYILAKMLTCMLSYSLIQHADLVQSGCIKGGNNDLNTSKSARQEERGIRQ